VNPRLGPRSSPEPVTLSEGTTISARWEPGRNNRVSATGEGPFEAAIELCERLDHEIPWMLEEGVAMEQRTGVSAREPAGGR
jgi:hypothetical protein